MAGDGEGKKLRTRKAEKGLDKRMVEDPERKRRRYVEGVETSNCNQKPGDRRQTIFQSSNPELFTKTEMLLIREIEDMKKWLSQLTACMLKNNTSSLMAKLVSQPPRKNVSEPPTLGSSSSKQDFRGKEIDKEPESVQQGSLASKIPKWMPVSFKPPQGMWITNTEEEVAVYIFMSTEILEGKEILVRSRYGGKFGIGDRRSLQTLMPSHYVSNEVISMVVCMMTNYRDVMSDYAFCWYLPPKFTQQALDLKATPNTLAHHYRTSFMGYVDLISKIFLPVNNEDLHWYLVVLDLEDEKVILLDSNPNPDRREWRLLQARKLVSVFMMQFVFQEILMDITFYELRTNECPRISEFPMVEPEGLFQHPSSYYDCGVIVAKWMMDSKDQKTYDRITLNSKSRMRLALDLVLDSHNNIKDEVVNMANMTLTTFIGAWANFED
ncbi:Ulp1 protease family, C-terminal catalytic domain [Sesbania bispinosa]|nr:Ulp1 protease family, C-terminal catalytic domain [Sesbania bispinosa]